MKNLTYYVSVFAVALAVASVARGNVTSATVTSGGQTQTINIVHAGPSSPASVSRGWGFIILPPGLSPMVASKSGVVVLSDGDSYYRWHGGVVHKLHAVLHNLPGGWVNPSDGKSYFYSRGSVRINAGGDIAIWWELQGGWRDGADIHSKELSILKCWALGETVSQDINPPLFTYQGSASRYGAYIFHKEKAHLHGYDDSGAIWATVGLEVVQADTHSWRLRQGLIRIDRGGAIFPTKLQAPDVENGTSFVVNGVSGVGKSIGHVVAGGTKTFFVGDTEVDFDPSYISNGWIFSVGANGHRVLRDPCHAIVPLPQDGTVEWVDGQDRLNGYYIDGSIFRRAVWLRRTDSSGRILDPVQYDRYDYLPLQPPGPWTTNHEVAPGSRSLQAGIVTRNDGSGEQRAFIAVPAELAVDANRDGMIELSSDGSRDEVSKGKPFRFWINDDDDQGPAAGDDIPARAPNKADYNNTVVDSVRDLVDFFPVFLDIKQLLSVLPHTTAGISYKLKQADGALNFVYTSLTKENLPMEKRSRAFDYNYKMLTTGFGPDFRQASGLATTEQITAAGTPLNTAFLDGVKNNDWGVILIEGRAATMAPLRLVVEKNDGTEIAEVVLHLKISPVEEMFRHLDLTGTPKNYDDTKPSLSETPEVTRTSMPANWPDTQTNGKYFVFLHGYNVDAQKARGWQAEVFKRLHVLGSKARFVGVTWHGATGLDYHRAVFHAFQTGDALADALSFTDDADVTVAAHSLGNMVVSHAIQSGGLTPARYYIINGATPLEAYASGDTDAGQAASMTELAWRNYDPRLYVANWHSLFPSSDNRLALTWKNIFASVRTRTVTHNFYSEEEEVVADADRNTTASIMTTLLNQGFNVTFGAWKAQELVKGVDWTTSLVSVFMIRGQAGWGFNTKWHIWTDPAGPPSKTDPPVLKRRPPERTLGITSEELKTKPFFDHFIESGLVSADAPSASSKAGEAWVRYDLFARGIPAMSNATAANFMPSLGDSGNFPMHTVGKVAANGPFPSTVDEEWRHSDFKDVGLPYVYPMYRAMIDRGGLNQ